MKVYQAKQDVMKPEGKFPSLNTVKLTNRVESRLKDIGKKYFKMIITDDDVDYMVDRFYESVRRDEVDSDDWDLCRYLIMTNIGYIITRRQLSRM